MQFYAFADELHKISAINVKNTFEAVHELAYLYTSFSKAQGDVLPFTTIDDFEAFGSETRQLARAATVKYVPMLHDIDELREWNEYSRSHTEWIGRSRHFQQDSADGNATNNPVSNRFTPYVYDGGSNIINRTKRNTLLMPAAPIWQV